MSTSTNWTIWWQIQCTLHKYKYMYFNYIYKYDHVLLRLRAFLSDEISLGWKMRRHRLNTDELFLGESFRWSLVHLATKIQFIRSGLRQPNFPAYSRSHGCHVNKFLCKIMILRFSENGPPSATHHHKSGSQLCLLSGRLMYSWKLFLCKILGHPGV